MIAKIPEKREDGDSSFKDLVEYMTNRDEDQEKSTDELNTSNRRRHLDVLRVIGINLATAGDHLRAAGRVDVIDGNAIRIRLGSVGRTAHSDAGKHDRSDRNADNPIEGEIDGREHQRSIARTRANLRAAGRYLGQAPEADRDFQERARARRAHIAFAADAAERRNRRDAGDIDADERLALLQLMGGPLQVVTSSGVVCEHNCLTLESASAEMAAVAAQNARVKDPVYHVVLSWAPGENPTDQEAFQSAHYALKAVGMSDHQYVFAVHRDTDNAHVHIAVNRVNPDTFKAVYPDRDYYKLDRAMRELELANGWQEVEGVFSIFERNGKKVIDWTSKSPDSKGKRPSKASEMERYDGSESFFTYVRNEPRKAIAAALKRETLTWQAVHHLLAKFNLELREKGQGFAIYDLGSDATTPIKASDLHEELSKSRLVKRLGDFQESRPVEVEPSTKYDKHKPLKRDPKVREDRRQARADARRTLRDRYQVYKKSFVTKRLNPADVKRRYALIAEQARDQRSKVKASKGSAAAKKAMYSVIAFETVRDRERLKAEIQLERNELRQDPHNKTRTFKQWVEEQAAAGDDAAISQVRGWAYSEKRKEKEIQDTVKDGRRNGLRHDSEADPTAKTDVLGMTFKVRRNGSVHYQNDSGQDQFIDQGRSIHLLPGADGERAVIAAALAYAKEKYGGRFELTGTDEFKKIAVEVMTEYKIAVTLNNTMQEAARKAYEAEYRASERKGGGKGRRPS
ncbi:TraI/MobA(P) family conjugative relaxase [Pseudomonas proteolytica]|uniref:TraI/MobA(P) family conjugative relaxase n=1 Tax=Pseudomonas proteolytica TaxID=219574 RepID=UPI001CA401A7|nr:TraI/MobA(P) family conjugative relaxase [Pseudomonas proteolytica]